MSVSDLLGGAYVATPKISPLKKVSTTEGFFLRVAVSLPFPPPLSRVISAHAKSKRTSPTAVFGTIRGQRDSSIWGHTRRNVSLQEVVNKGVVWIVQTTFSQGKSHKVAAQAKHIASFERWTTRGRLGAGVPVEDARKMPRAMVSPKFERGRKMTTKKFYPENWRCPSINTSHGMTPDIYFFLHSERSKTHASAFRTTCETSYFTP
mmetsp:Transcript_2451/g.3589  ORF Transcript_2451/g.3589 Transcript_2451/m.3589 type:complete len:206 (-) Transcript_2451:16-633(-)